MIGNDVVDLELAKTESNWQRKGYLEKIYTEFEQNLIYASKNPNEMVWILWSLKESTYKAYQRIHYNRGYYPKKIQILELKLIGNQFHSKIELFGMVFYGSTKIKKTWIDTIVVFNQNDFKRIKNYTANTTGKDRNLLPFCFISKNPLSISHHGSFKKIIELQTSES